MTAILLVTSPAWHYRLLRVGPCGAAPSTAWRQGAEALVLMWYGAVVPEGRDRALRCLAEREGLDASGGLLWRLAAEQDPDNCPSWELVDANDEEHTYYAHGTGPDDTGGDTYAVVPELIDEMVSVHALAVVCAARGLGEVVMLP